jgi:hypothetical protein
VSHFELYEGDCREVMKAIPDASIDAVVTDPPYPEIDRDYGHWTEDEWLEMMGGVVAEVRRVLKPQGSAMFVVQPSSERLGRMRPVLYRWLLELCTHWNVVQDVYWWNFAALPTAHCARGVMRPSVKWCVWCGPPDCFRDSGVVLWAPSEAMRAIRLDDRALRRSPSGASVRKGRIAETVAERGGTTPFNLIPCANAGSSDADANAHTARTPETLASWWVRYLTRHGDTVLDPFAGSGTIGMAALRVGRSYIGIEKHAPYIPIARDRLTEAMSQPSLAL